MKNKLKYCLFLCILVLLLLIVLLYGCSSKSSKNNITTTTGNSNEVQNNQSLENHTHTWSAWITSANATCTTKGLQYRTCECGATDKIEHAILPHNLSAWTVINEAKCGVEGTEMRTCSTCTLTETKSINALSHTEGNWKIINNEKHFLCIYCSTSMRTEQINISIGLEIESGNVISLGNCTDADIIIPSNYENFKVTIIDEYCFSYKSNIKSIVLPETITTIKMKAFYQFANLENIHLSANITTIEDYAFSKCYSLKTISLSKSLTTIGNSAFAYCSKLESVYMDKSVTNISGGAFQDCTLLTDIYFNGTMEEWNSIEKGKNWDLGITTYTIHCNDGDITK